MFDMKCEDLYEIMRLILDREINIRLAGLYVEVTIVTGLKTSRTDVFGLISQTHCW